MGERSMAGTQMLLVPQCLPLRAQTLEEVSDFSQLAARPHCATSHRCPPHYLLHGAALLRL